MNSRDLAAAPEEDGAGVSVGNLHEAENGKGKKEKLRGDGDGIEEDGFFGEESSPSSSSSEE